THSLTLAAAVAGEETEEQRRRDTEGGETVGLGLDDRGPRVQADAVVTDLCRGQPGDFNDRVSDVGAGDAAGGADARGERRPMPVGTAFPVARGADIDQRGVDRP